MEAPRPITRTRNVAVIDGGHLKQPYYAELQCLEGGEYLPIRRDDRNLARALGLDVTQRAPWGKTLFLDELQRARNIAVGEAIVAAQCAADPNADVDEGINKPAIGRLSAFVDANLAESIIITAPAFEARDGTKYGARNLTVLTAGIKAAPISLRFDEDTLNYLMAAVTSPYFSTKERKRKHEMPAYLPELAQPNCRWKRKRGVWSVYCNYYKDGKWRQRSRAPGVGPNTNIEDSVRLCEDVIQAFYNEHHEAPDGNDAYVEEEVPLAIEG